MRRIWVFLRVDTLVTAIQTLKRFVILDHRWHLREEANEEDRAAEDLRRAQRLSETGASKDEIEHETRKVDGDLH